MSDSNIILGFLAILFFTTTVITLIMYLKNRGKQSSLPTNGKIFVNFAPHLTSGHALGIIKSQTTAPNNPRSQCIKFYPRDKREEDGKVIGADEVLLPIRNSKVEELPMGKLSWYRDIAFGLPKDASDFDPEFLKTSLGQALAYRVESINVLESAIETFKQSGKATAEIVRRLSNDELLNDLITKEKNMMKSLSQEVVSEKVDSITKKGKIPR